MTVKEAIEELKKFPDDMEIVVGNGEQPEFVTNEDIRGYKWLEIWGKEE